MKPRRQWSVPMKTLIGLASCVAGLSLALVAQDLELFKPQTSDSPAPTDDSSEIDDRETVASDEAPTEEETSEADVEDAPLRRTARNIADDEETESNRELPSETNSEEDSDYLTTKVSDEDPEEPVMPEEEGHAVSKSFEGTASLFTEDEQVPLNEKDSDDLKPDELLSEKDTDEEPSLSPPNRTEIRFGNSDLEIGTVLENPPAILDELRTTEPLDLVEEHETKLPTEDRTEALPEGEPAPGKGDSEVVPFPSEEAEEKSQVKTSEEPEPAPEEKPKPRIFGEPDELRMAPISSPKERARTTPRTEVTEQAVEEPAEKEEPEAEEPREEAAEEEKMEEEPRPEPSEPAEQEPVAREEEAESHEEPKPEEEGEESRREDVEPDAEMKSEEDSEERTEAEDSEESEDSIVQTDQEHLLRAVIAPRHTSTAEVASLVKAKLQELEARNPEHLNPTAVAYTENRVVIIWDTETVQALSDIALLFDKQSQHLAGIEIELVVLKNGKLYATRQIPVRIGMSDKISLVEGTDQIEISTRVIRAGDKLREEMGLPSTPHRTSILPRTTFNPNRTNSYKTARPEGFDLGRNNPPSPANQVGIIPPKPLSSEYSEDEIQIAGLLEGHPSAELVLEPIPEEGLIGSEPDKMCFIVNDVSVWWIIEQAARFEGAKLTCGAELRERLEHHRVKLTAKGNYTEIVGSLLELFGYELENSRENGWTVRPAEMVVRSYPVQGTMIGGGLLRDEIVERFLPLSWKSVGGGTAEYATASSQLVVRHTTAMHERIARYLELLSTKSKEQIEVILLPQPSIQPYEGVRSR